MNVVSPGEFVGLMIEDLLAAQKGHTKAGGRKKGTPNKITADIKAALRTAMSW